MGATAGRTTLNGEGLQHQDGHSLLLASTVPSVRAWDPAYAYELATIIQFGIQEMVQDERDMIHYVMLYNDNESQPKKPEGCEDGIIRGAYLIRKSQGEDGPLVRLLGSGPILKNVVSASEKLHEYGVRTEVCRSNQLWHDYCIFIYFELHKFKTNKVSILSFLIQILYYSLCTRIKFIC